MSLILIKKIILISTKKEIKNTNIENLGAELYEKIKDGKNREYTINTETIKIKHSNFISHFLHGFKLKSYKFDKYKTKKEPKIIKINVIGKNKQTFTS